MFVVIRNRNKFKLTSACINSLYAINYSNLRIIVVDDASSDNSPELLLERFPHVILIRTEEYVEYCKGYNLGIKRALADGAEYIFILNNDTKDFSKEYLKRVVEIFENDNKVGLVGSRVMNPNGSVRWGGGERGMYGFSRNTPDCGFIVKREVFDRIGFLDEDYIRYFEDLDYIIRLRNAGYKTYYANDISFTHIGAGTVSRYTHTFHYYRTRGIYVFMAKWCADKSNKWKAAETEKILLVNYKYLHQAPNKHKIEIMRAIDQGEIDGKSYCL